MNQRQAETTHSREEGFLTTGQAALKISSPPVVEALADVSRFEVWLLRGMSEEEARRNRLKVSLNEIAGVNPEENSCLIAFSLLITRNWILRDKHVTVLIRSIPGPAGSHHIRYELPPLGGALIKEAAYDVFITPDGPEVTVITYRFRVRLAGIADWLFSDRLYARNMEWYIDKIMENCIAYLGEPG